jgi:ribonuclease E
MLESELYDRESNDSTSRASAPADGASRDNSPGGRGAGDLNPPSPATPVAPAAPAVPAALFQPPAPVLFQAPTSRPEPVAPARAENTAPRSGSSASAGGARNGVRDAKDNVRDGARDGAGDSARDGARDSDGARDGGDGPDDDDDGTGAGRRRRRRSTRSRSRSGEDAAADANDGQADSQSEGASAEDQPEAEAGGTGTQGAQGAQGAQGDAKRPRTRSRRSRSGARDGDGADADSSVNADADAADDDNDADGGADGSADDDQSVSGRRRRRKRRRGSADGSDSPNSDDPPDTVVHVREPNGSQSGSSSNDVRAIRGSTRLEAKKQRRREGRETGRRRPPIVTESEFLARRESVERSMVVRQRKDRTQIAVLEDGVLVEHYVNRSSHQSYVGNVYLGKVQNVLPSMEAAFVDIGKGRNAVLYAGEVNFDVSGMEGQPKRIESALKAGQSLLVQVTKDPVGHKGARLTSQVSLPGRYLVYVPGSSMTGISRKLPDTERNRLKQILKKVMPENAGVIVRTAAEGAAEEELARDVARLAAQWEAIEKKSKTASAPALLYGEPDLTVRVIRDVFNEDFSKLVVSGDEAWDVVDEYVSYVAPHLAERVTRWEGAKDAFAQFRVDEQLAKALERKVWLPSGGSLVIDKTEAMTVVDVNTGKFTGQGGNLEETVTRNNLEAAEEIVRQLRLRDVGGIVVIDFIDMVLESNRELVLRRLLECLARDRTKHQVAEVTSLGLVQMTRKRVGAGLLEAFSTPCECCNGRGVILTFDPDADGHPSPHTHSRGHGGGHGGGGGGGHGGGGNGGNGGNGHGNGGNGNGNRMSGPAAVAAASARGRSADGDADAGPDTAAASAPVSGDLATSDTAAEASAGAPASATATDPGAPSVGLPPDAVPAQTDNGQAPAEAARSGNGRRRRRKPAATSDTPPSAAASDAAPSAAGDTRAADAASAEAAAAPEPSAVSGAADASSAPRPKTRSALVSAEVRSIPVAPLSSPAMPKSSPAVSTSSPAVQASSPAVSTSSPAVEPSSPAAPLSDPAAPTSSPAGTPSVSAADDGAA